MDNRFIYNNIETVWFLDIEYIKRVIWADDSASRLTSGSGLRILLFHVTREPSISQSIVSKW